ncbi:MAG: hypothetical protein R2798_06760 [Chitinophagales bacterium]|nr:hypothetical protein [Bacteroidota bacterium]
MKYFVWRSIILYLSIIGCFASLRAQEKNAVAFAQYLSDYTLYRDLDVWVKEQLPLQKIPAADSLRYISGLALYKQKKLILSNDYFLEINPASSFYTSARLRAAGNATFLNKYTQAKQILLEIPLEDSLLLSLQNLHLAGISALQRDWKTWNKYAGNFSQQYYQIADYEIQLGQHAQELQQLKRKSPWVAGSLSAIVPGLGKVYAGSYKKGIGALLPISVLAIQTYEQYRKRGIKHPLTLFYGSLFSLFYIGNIWGSALSVQVNYQHETELLENHILLDMHVPLRNVLGD